MIKHICAKMRACLLLERKEIIKFLKRSEGLVCLEIGIYTVLFSFLTISKIYAFQANAYDLGNYNQALHTTLFDARLFYYTADLAANPSGSLFGVHFSPIFIGMLPFYAIYPSPSTMLVIQSFTMSLGALPVYHIATKKLENEKWGFVFSTLYLLNPALQGVNWYDFHPEAFLPTLILFSIFFFNSGKFGKYFMSIALVLMCLEFSAVLVIFMSMYFLLELKPWKKEVSNSSEIKILSITLLLAFAWLILSLQIVHRFNPLVRPMTGDIYWRELGANSLLEVPAQAIFHPTRMISALCYDGWQKLSYVLILLGSVGFLPILEPLTIVCFLPWMSIAFLSNYSPFYQLGVQYPAFLIPFIFLGAILGMKKLRRLTNKRISKKNFQRIIAILIGISFVFAAISSPLVRSPYQSYTYITYGFPEITQHDRNVLKLLELIPPKASVLTQNNVFPLLSNRIHAYLFPFGNLYPPGETFFALLNRLVSKVDFIIVDIKTDIVAPATLLSYLSKTEDFGVYASIDGAILLKRDFSEPTSLFQPVENTFDYRSLLVNDGIIVKDKESKSGKVLLHSRSNKSAVDFWYGPYIFLPPGKYEISYRMKIENSIEGDIIVIDVSCWMYKILIEYVGTEKTGYHLNFLTEATGEKRTFASLTLNSKDFDDTHYSDFSLNFTVTELGPFEFRGMNIISPADIYLDKIELTQIEPTIQLNLQVHEMFPA